MVGSYSLISQPNFHPQIQQPGLVIDCPAHMVFCGSSDSILGRDCAPRRCRMVPIRRPFRRLLCVLFRRAWNSLVRVGEARPAPQAVLSRPPLWCDVKRRVVRQCCSQSDRIVVVRSETVGLLGFVDAVAVQSVAVRSCDVHLFTLVGSEKARKISMTDASAASAGHTLWLKSIYPNRQGAARSTRNQTRRGQDVPLLAILHLSLHFHGQFSIHPVSRSFPCSNDTLICVT
jgi:hypothetical protein